MFEKYKLLVLFVLVLGTLTVSSIFNYGYANPRKCTVNECNDHYRKCVALADKHESSYPWICPDRPIYNVNSLPMNMETKEAYTKGCLRAAEECTRKAQEH
jgi:hypothetical protein